jgi:2-iminobutanoate/2-iminopropanoate deaminase
MNEIVIDIEKAPQLDTPLTPDALEELHAMGLTLGGSAGEGRRGIDPVPGRPALRKQAIRAPEVLNEAYDYSLPSSFSRGMRVPLPGATMLFLSGTASVDEYGRTVYPGDFQAQCLRTFRNLTQLLDSEQASWHDIIRTTCYLRDIERDYDVFNQVRTLFFHGTGVDPLPASTGIQVRLCRSDLLIEIEAIAMVPREDGR